MLLDKTMHTGDAGAANRIQGMAHLLLPNNNLCAHERSCSCSPCSTHIAAAGEQLETVATMVEFEPRRPIASC